MSNIFEFKGYKPYIHPTAFIHPMACIIGNVSIGKDVFVGAGAVIRGDWGEVIIEDGCNVQENCIIHMFPGTSVILKTSAHIGHGAIIHGGIIGKNCLIGMNSVVMDDVEIGDECIVGALTLIPQEMKIPPRKVVVGNPAKILKDVTDEMIQWKTEGTKLYQQLPKECFESLKPCEPLKEKPLFRKIQESHYQTLKKQNKKS